eukprot:s287_g1.t2
MVSQQGASQSVADEGDGLCHACSTFLGCFIFIALLGLLQEHLLSSLSETYQVQLPLLSAAWGAAAVQVFSSWQHDGAQPRSVLLGNFLGHVGGCYKKTSLGPQGLHTAMLHRLWISLPVLQHAFAEPGLASCPRSTCRNDRKDGDGDCRATSDVYVGGQKCGRKTGGSSFIQAVVRSTQRRAESDPDTMPNTTEGGENGTDLWWPWLPWPTTTAPVTTVPPPARSDEGRRLQIINRCTRPMIMHPTGGNSDIPCGSGCPGGMTCNPYDRFCYFDLPEPSAGWTIPPGATMEVFTPNVAVRQGNGVVADWSGKLEFYPNASMDMGPPASALCNGQSKCPTYQGLNGVATAVEFTFVPHGADFYDVSIINGFNIGIEMKPDGSFRPVVHAGADSRGYNCGAAGAMAQADRRLSACPWEFSKRLQALGQADISPLLTQVDGGYGYCRTHGDCQGQDIVCGQVAKAVWDWVAQVYRPTTQITMERLALTNVECGPVWKCLAMQASSPRCGHRIGVWSVYQLCVWSGNTYRSPAPFDGLIDCPSMHYMFACAGPAPWTTTCYNDVPAGGECCGCANWTEALGIPIPEGGKGCQGASQTWQVTAQPFYEILKAGCPTAYTFAFDDETSTFTCRTAESQEDDSIPNRAGYNITLCPTDPDFVELGGADQACRGEAWWDNNNMYFIHFSGQTLSECKMRCRLTDGCKGIEYGPFGRCEVWTRSAGIQSTRSLAGYSSCLLSVRLALGCFRREVPFEFQQMGTGKDEACRGLTARDSSEHDYRLYVNETFSGCQRRCRVASDVCQGIDFGVDGRCEVWTHSAGIQATVPVMGHSCYIFAPSDFESVGGENQACRGRTWYDNSPLYYTHVRDQSLDSCKSLCRGMGTRCKGIEFGSCAGLVKILPVGLELQAALAVAATIAAQELTGSIHPAGAANAVIFLEAQSCSWPSFACMCASAAVLLVAVAALFNNTCMDRLYPQAWWPSPAVESEIGSAPKPPVGFIVDAPQQWLPTYLLKLRGAGNRGPVLVSYAHTCFSSLAAFAYMVSVASLNDLLGWTPASLVGPAAASVSVFSDWRGASSQPWPCVVGCVLGAASGSLFLEASEGGSAFAGHLWMPAAMAVAFSAALQELAFARIPAGGSIALSIIVMPEARRRGWSFVLQPGVLSTCLLVIYGALLNNLQETRLYPRHWPWQHATPGLPQQGHSERVLQRHRSDVEKTPFSALAKTNVGLLMVLSQIVFLIFLMFAELDKTSVDVVEKFDHVAGLSLLTVVGLGFMRAFAKAHGLGAVAFCLVITSLAIQWSMVLESLLNQTALSIGLDSLSSGYFAAATALVSFGALIGKVSLRQVFLVLLIELPCYCWTRSGGLSRDRVPQGHLDGLDGLEIHLFGALFGYSAACLLGPFEMDWLHQGSYGLDLVSLLGTLCFWICFPNIGYGSRTQHAHIIVVLALLGSTVAAFVTDSLSDSGKLSVACIRTAVLAGGIAISAVAETVDPAFAVMVGSVAGAISVLGLRFLSRSSVDTCGVLFAHGMPALLGWILYASPVLQNSAKAHESPAVQLSRLGSCAVTAILSGCCCGYLLRRTRSESQDLATSDEAIWVCAQDMPLGSATYRPIK